MAVPAMKSRISLRLLATFTVLGLVHPLMAASSKKNEPQRKALVAALLVVSPDPLGGQLGLNLAAEHAPATQTSQASPRVASQSAKTPDNLAYRSWKASKNS
jgi:hypothetical protein